VIRYIDEFRSSAAAEHLLREIRENMPARPVSFMEICGGHTLTAVRYGLHGLLPRELTLISGPGCPVCVTSRSYIDTAVALAAARQAAIVSFGDMLKVPGTASTLAREKAAGRDIRICLSPLEAVAMAAREPEREIVFLGIGFETTAPAVAMAIIEARERHCANFSVLAALKTMPPAMMALLQAPDVRIDGFVCPGHVTAVAGSKLYDPVVRRYRVPCVVSGFEPVDMLQTVLMLLRQTNEGRADTEIQYTRAVTPDGNRIAREAVEGVCEPDNADWRGLGLIPGSGLRVRPEYAGFDASRKFAISVPEPVEPSGCRCGDVMRGSVRPPDCPLFGDPCTPDDPVGACMVSAEGACGIHFRYGHLK
jgi:hydrogenase expression/formation protein HypD